MMPAVATSFKVRSPVTAIVALSVIPPAVAVTLRVPPTVLSVPPSRISLRLLKQHCQSQLLHCLQKQYFQKVWPPEVPAFKVTAPENAFAALSKIMFEPSAPNVKTDAPLTVSVSLSVMSPVVADCGQSSGHRSLQR